MCGIIGAVAQYDITKVLLEGLSRLEYRGYDSAGLAILNDNSKITILREIGKVKILADKINQFSVVGNTGIAHTRWATHGKPEQKNAHPHISECIAVIHNGIIENYIELKEYLKKQKYNFNSDTDTEIIAHLTNYELKKRGGTLLEVVQRVLTKLEGTCSTVIMNTNNPGLLVTVCSGSPIVIGIGISGNFIASDHLAILPVTRHFIYLEEGDIAEVTSKTVRIFDLNGVKIERKMIQINMKYDVFDKGIYQHYMHKEIHEQPLAIRNTIEGRFNNYYDVNLSELEKNDQEILSKVEHIQIVACGTSYNAGMVARYWLESLADIPCEVEIASEYRYRIPVRRKSSVLITLSQSGETADTLASLRLAKELGYYLASIAICNVSGSSIVRESDIALMTKAGIEIGVASTKAFTAQLTLLLLLVAYLIRLKTNNVSLERQIVKALSTLPEQIANILSKEQEEIIAVLAKDFSDKTHAIYLGRADQYPIAVEGALKLKEISYIHAEAYAAGELKHGPLALIDAYMPVIVIVPNNSLLEKLKSNIEEVRARGGLLYIFADKNVHFIQSENMKIISLPNVEELIAPIYYTIPLQLLAYYAALIKGTNIDQPRNLAKSVTVE